MTENIYLDYSDINSRNIAGLTFAKWFDEPFTVDVLNNLHYNNTTYTLLDTVDDKLHRDFSFYDNTTGAIYYVDAKTCTLNFSNNTIRKTTDVLSIGEHALYAATEYISFVYCSRLYMMYLSDITKVKPIYITYSRGQNGNAQNIYNYEIKDVIQVPSTCYINLTEDIWTPYSRAYNIMADIKQKIYIHDHMYNISYNDKKMYRIQHIEQMREQLIPIIQEINKIFAPMNTNTNIYYNIVDDLQKIDTLINF